MEPAGTPLEARSDPSSPLWARSDSRRGLLDDDALKDLLEDGGAGRRGIRCPVCGWEPGPGDRWMCLCGYAWNTFDTHGRCPGCDRQWDDTQCLSCGAWSPHEDWYVDEPGEGGS